MITSGTDATRTRGLIGSGSATAEKTARDIFGTDILMISTGMALETFLDATDGFPDSAVSIAAVVGSVGLGLSAVGEVVSVSIFSGVSSGATSGVKGAAASGGMTFLASASTVAALTSEAALASAAALASEAARASEAALASASAASLALAAAFVSVVALASAAAW